MKIAFGTDSGVSPHGTNAEEFDVVEAGMSAHDAILSATAQTADLLNIDTELAQSVKANWLTSLPWLATFTRCQRDGISRVCHERRSSLQASLNKYMVKTLKRKVKHWVESPHMLAGIGRHHLLNPPLSPFPSKLC